jgi:hypothetical protein
MCGATARTAIMVLVLTGIALALPTQGAAARSASAAATAFVNGDRWPPHHIVKVRGGHRFVGHRVHHAGPRALHRWQRHSRHAAGKLAVRAFQRNAAHHAGFHNRTWRRVSKPAFHAPQRHGFSGPRLISVDRSGTQRFDGHSVVVFKGPGFHSFTGDPRQARHGAGGGKLILLPSSPRFKHIVVVPSHRHVVD